MIRLTPPTQRAYISSTWGRSRAYRSGWHEGLDFPDKEGSPVLAAADGVVSHVDNVNNSFAGRWIAINHGNGVTTRYLHNDQNLVHKGQRVRRGETIASVGTTGTKRSHPHVHFDVKMHEPGLSQYMRRFGEPTTGLGRKSSMGYGVPAEALMSGATYSEKAKAFALGKGVRFYKPSVTSGMGFMQWVAVGFIGWGTWKLLRSP